MPEILSFTDDSQFPNFHFWSGYQTYEVFEAEPGAWSCLSAPRSFSIVANGEAVGDFAVGRDGMGAYRFGESFYGIHIKDGEPGEETYFLEVFDPEFERLLGRSMAHGRTSVVGIAGFEIHRSVMGRQYGQEGLHHRSACAVKMPAGQVEHQKHGLLARVLVRDGHPEPDLFILNVLMLSHRTMWHAIAGTDTKK